MKHTADVQLTLRLRSCKVLVMSKMQSGTLAQVMQSLSNVHDAERPSYSGHAKS